MEYLVDINIAVYNQAPYLETTLESVLSQKTNFPFRLLIGDDCSTDGSVEILKNYESRYPNKVKVIYQAKNIGINSPERNGIILLKNSTSKYIALLDGDDYWVDNFKLQKQIDFLEKNQRYVGCFHNTVERYDDDELASHLYCNFQAAQSINFNDLCFSNIIPTCSVIYRNKLFGELPDWYHKLKMGDWPLHLLNSQFGDFWYIPKIMGVHRLHKKSSWMLQDPEANKKYTLEAYDVMIKEFSGKPELQKQLIVAKEYFIHPPKNHSSPSVARRGINLIKKIIR